MSKLKRLTVNVVLVIAVSPVVFVCYAIVVLLGGGGIDDAYAQWGAADMVVDYMREHNGAWPTDWKSLEPYFEESNGRVTGWSFDHFQSHIFIDFGADVDALRAASLKSKSVPFDVIHATWPWAAQIGGGPNELLHEYFRDPEPCGEAPAGSRKPDEPADATERRLYSELDWSEPLPSPGEPKGALDGLK